MSKCFSPAATICCFDWSEGSKTFSSLLHLMLPLHFFNIVIFLTVYTLAVTSQPSNACMTKHSSHNSSLNLLFAYSISQIFVSCFTFEFYSHVRNTGCDVETLWLSREIKRSISSPVWVVVILRYFQARLSEVSRVLHHYPCLTQMSDLKSCWYKISMKLCLVC